MENNQNSNKFLIVICYLLPLIGLILYFTNKDALPKEKENYAQAGTLFIIQAIISVITSILSFLSFIGILNLVMFIFAIIAAVKSDSNNIYEIPVVYNFSKSIFK